MQIDLCCVSPNFILKTMPQNHGDEEESRRGEQELLMQVLEPIIRQIRGTIRSQQNVNSSEGELMVSSVRKVVEVMVIRALHCLIEPVMEGLMRKLAKEVIESAIEKILTGNYENEMPSLEQRRLQLEFKSKLLLPVWTGIPIKGERSTSIEVALVDCLTGDVVKSIPEASAKVEIVVVQGDDDDDHHHDGGNDWTLEEFNRKIIGGREGNKSLLNGNVFLKLQDGIGYVGEIYFTHRSNWMRNCRFRLGARVVDKNQGTRVREAKTESFTIRDRRLKLYEKHDIPSPSDAVWRLKNIGRRGAIYKRLTEGNIKTVQQFLTEYFENPEKLKEILGAAMSGKMLKETVAHALKCKLDKLHEEEKISDNELVVNAFKQSGKVIPIDENVPKCGPYDSCKAFGASESQRLEFSSGDNNGTPDKIDKNISTQQPCNSSLGITSCFMRSMSSAGDFGIVDDPDFIHAPLSALDQFPNSPILFQHFLGNNFNVETGNFLAEICANKPRGKAAIRRWVRTSIVMRFHQRIKMLNPNNHKRQRCS